ncbi:AAA domain-containing protein [Ureaplasma ceti]|uniref:AAA domain-containing protein n=1 Tax=Ureaplasma ceti TaxID=3119530 RepID=A0ABP9U8Z7_9BACT
MNESSSLKSKLLLASKLQNDNSITTKLNDNNTDLKKWSFDQDILDFLLDSGVDVLPVDKYINPNEITYKLENSQNAEEFIKLAKEANVYIKKDEKELLRTDFLNNKNQVFSRISDDIILGNKRFLRTKREADRRYNDESVWYLYVAAYFLKGKAVDGTIINSPLLLYKVDVTEKNGQIIIIKKEKVPTINAKLNLFLNRTYELGLGTFDDVENFEILVEEYSPFLKNIIGQNLKDIVDKENLVEFNNYDLSEITFQIEPSIVFGLMDPCGGIVLSDYEKIVKSDEDPFKEISVISNTNVYEEEVIEKDDIVMFDRPLNIYQKYAVKSALGESTLVFGPPGTGKSQVISTIIANILNNNKTVLMVSEKKAALDVLEERLKAIEDICLFAYDDQDVNYFYGKIKKLHDLLNNDLNKVALANSEGTYSKIKEMYNDLRTISSLTVNNKHLEEINYIDKKDFKHDLDMIMFASDILKLSKQSSLNVLFQQYSDLFKTLYDKKEYFPDVILKAELMELKALANNSHDPNLVYKLFFSTHKVKKPNLFSKFSIKMISALELDHLKEYVDKLLELNIDQLSMSQIYKIISWNNEDLVRLQDEVESYLLWKEINKIDYLSKPLLDTVATNYLNNQKRMVKNVDIFIRDNYLNNLRDWIKEVESSDDQETKNQLKELFRIASLKKAKSINATIKNFYKVLRKLFPIWILNPIQTSQVIPCEPQIFDYGIFDEASQMFYENSYPLVYRCKNNIVSGDDKQLSPIGNFVSKAFDNYDNYDEDGDSSIVSLFEKATTLSWPHFQLKNHYRSWSADLISFANRYIYNNEMKIVTINGDFHKVVKTIDVNGYLDDTTLTNNAEVDTVLELIKNDYADRRDVTSYTTLIVALNNQQVDLLEAEFNSKMPLMCQNAVDAYNTGTLSFGTIENIQGEEADNVIISLTYAKNKDGKLTTDFGSIASESGTSRINVAITRAIKSMTIVKSLSSRDTIMATNPDLNIFFKFVAWCEQINSKPSLNDILFDNIDSSSQPLETPFANKVLNELKLLYNNDRYNVLTNICLGSRLVDICIVDKVKRNVALCISLDDDSYNYGLKKMIEEIDSQKLLQDRGYKAIKIMMIDWVVRKDMVLNEIENALTSNN